MTKTREQQHWILRALDHLSGEMMILLVLMAAIAIFMTATGGW